MDLSKLKEKLKEAKTDPGKGRQLMREISAALVDEKLAEADRNTLEVAAANLHEWYDDGPYVSTYGAKSFKDLDASAAAQETAASIGELTNQYRDIISNIMYGDETPSDKLNALRRLGDEFQERVRQAFNLARESAAPPAGQQLAESIYGAAITLIEADAATNTGSRAPLDIDVKLITPGWGNKRDNHYYSAEVLKRDASIFAGVKMYATDHVASEKNVRTEVSQIRSITGFADDGAPIARVTVHDPSFAEMVRNRHAAGLLESLECSILAYGSAKKGKAPDGREGNIVEAITAAQSVDWVTKAGAGGRALSLSETAAPVVTPKVIGQAEGKTMLTEAEIKAKLSESKLPAAAQAKLAGATYADLSALETAITAETDYLAAYLREAEVSTEDLAAIQEQLTAAETALAAVKAALAALAGPAPVPAAAPAAKADGVPAAAVAAELAKTTLPKAAQDKLAAGTYATLAEVATAVTAETEYLKSATGSGRPFMRKSVTEDSMVRPLEERAAVADHILDTTFGNRQPVRNGKDK